MAKIFVRGLEYEDLPSRVSWYNNPDIFEGVYLDLPFTLSGTRDWFSKNSLNQSRKDFSFDYCNNDESPKLIGMGGLVDIDFKHRRAERYFVLDPLFHRKKIGLKILNWICNFGFIILNLNRIFGTSVEGNEVILKVNQREGWIHEGTLRKNIYYNGKFLDQHIKSLLRNEWENQTWKAEKISFEIPIEEC